MFDIQRHSEWPPLNPASSAFYVSAPCGSGKTYGMCQSVAKNFDISNYLITCPTIKMMAETRLKLEEAGAQVTCINHETHAGSVTQAITAYLQKAESFGEVLLITAAAFAELKYFPRRYNWIVIIDEIPQVDRFFDPSIPYSVEFVKELITVESLNDKLLRVKPRNGAKELSKFLNRPTDAMHEPFADLLREVASPHKDVFVDAKSWARIAEKREIDARRRSDRNKVYFISMLSPRALHPLALLGANIQDSLIFSWFKGFHGITWVEEQEITKRLRDVPPPGTRAQICYFFEERKFSKSLAAEVLPNGLSVREAMDKAAIDRMAGRPCLYVENKGLESSSLGNAPNMTKIPVQAHGLNEYSSFHNVYISAALNKSPQHYQILMALGFTAPAIDRATSHEYYYQIAMRTSLRDPSSTEPVMIIVPDKPSADRLAVLIHAPAPQKLGHILPDKVIYTAVQKQQRSATKKVGRLLLNPKNEPFPLCNKRNGTDSGSNPEELDSLDGAEHLNIFVTFHGSPYSLPAEHYSQLIDVQEFIGHMRKFGRTPLVEKEEGLLFNSAAFNPQKGQGYKCQEYFVSSSFMVLDFDNGSLSPDAFDKIFWDDAPSLRRSFLLCNTFSRSPEQPNRFRAILFYRKPAMSIEAHQAVYDSIVDRLADSGYPADEAKLDPQCRSGVQSFWMPCTNKLHQGQAFFLQRGTRTREILKFGIDPDYYLRTKPSSSVSVRPALDRRSSTDRRTVDHMIGKLQAMSEGRHALFFDIAVGFHRLGLSLAEISEELRVAAKGDKKLIGKIKGCIRSLKTGRYR
jgi:hypothetical protein